MLPSETRLLHGIRHALADLAASGLGAEGQRVLANVDLALNELMLRQDRDFFAWQYNDAVALAAEGLALLGTPVEGAEDLATMPETIDPALSRPLVEDRIEAVGRILMKITGAATQREKADPRLTAYLARIVDWENRLYAARQRRHGMAATAAGAGIGVFTAATIEQYLRKRFPDRPAQQVTGLKVLGGGFSKATVLFDVEEPGQAQSLVIRAEQPLSLIILEGAKVRNEFFVLKLAHAAGLRVAEPLWLEMDTAPFGQSLLVSRKAAGRNLGSRIDIGEQLTEALLRDFIEQLVRIHKTRIDPRDENVRRSHLGRWTAFSTLTECVTEEVRYWKEQVGRRNLPASPILSRTLEWLGNNVPVCDEKPSLIHGDYGLHNILVEGERVSCVLDWEAACLGDPADDLAWLMDGLAAQVDRRRILDLYAEASGAQVPEARLRYFGVFNALRFAFTCPTALQMFERHPAMDIGATQLGLIFMHHGTGHLNRCIELAEQAKAGR